MLFIKSNYFGLYAQRSGPPRTLLGSGKAAPRSFLMFNTNVCLSVCLSVCLYKFLRHHQTIGQLFAGR